MMQIEMQITRVFCARGSYASILCKWQEYSVQQNCNFHHAVSSVTCKALCVQCSEPKCIDCSLPALALAFQPQCNAKAKPCKARVQINMAWCHWLQPSSASNTISQVHSTTCVNCSQPSAHHMIWQLFPYTGHQLEHPGKSSTRRK